MLAIKVYILYDSNSMTFWKRLNYGDSEKMSGCQKLGGREDDQVEHRGSKPTERTPPR